MSCPSIRLPGAGDAAPLFSFNRAEAESLRLMQQQPLGGSDSDASKSPYSEQWHCAGPVNQQMLTLDDLQVMCRTNPHYQLLNISVPLDLDHTRCFSERLYRTVLQQIAQSAYPQLVRCWNYVPQINAGVGDNEVYRQFCWGRADAFADYHLALPAATGIGSHDGILRVAVLSTVADTQLTHIENPRQVSAYDYPRRYGPRSPSFARATWVARDNAELLLVSGTSSIVDHETLHPGDVVAQTKETASNIAHLLQNYQRQLPQANPNPQPLAVRFYLRDPEMLATAAQAYADSFNSFPTPGFFAADICRSDLAMEIEAVFG